MYIITRVCQILPKCFNDGNLIDWRYVKLHTHKVARMYTRAHIHVHTSGYNNNLYISIIYFLGLTEYEQLLVNMGKPSRRKRLTETGPEGPFCVVLKNQLISTGNIMDVLIKLPRRIRHIA